MTDHEENKNKHLVNDIDEAVPETLSGLCKAYPRLVHCRSHGVVLAPDWNKRNEKAAVICGGGSGHEPFTAGFVGTGMLTASVSGSIFAAPPSTHIEYAIKLVSSNSTGGVFVIIPNYTGDRLNFGIAVEKTRQLGINVEDIFVGEDCSIPKDEQSSIGKRGLTGMVFAIKIIGALAENGATMKEMKSIANVVVENMATYSIGLTACSIPGQGLMFEMEQNEIECGMGIHGEAGYERIKIGKAMDIVDLMLNRICESLDIKSGSVAVLINNFGALSQLEQGIIVHEVVTQLKNRGIEPLRVYSGVLVTSLNSAGVHVTLLKLDNEYKNILLTCLDKETEAPKWPGCVYSIPIETPTFTFNDGSEKKNVEVMGPEFNEKQQKLMRVCLENSCKSIIQNENKLNNLDRGCGDGDCGTTLRRLAESILSSLNELNLSHPATLLSKLANIAEDSMGGTSGALYCLFFTTGANELKYQKEMSAYEWHKIWAHLMRCGITCLMKYGRSKIGDRTMLDSLEPACKTFEEIVNANNSTDGIVYTDIVESAWRGCNFTKNIKPMVGRASYVKQVKYLQEVDAGAYAVATWINAIVQTVIKF